MECQVNRAWDSQFYYTFLPLAGNIFQQLEKILPTLLESGLKITHAIFNHSFRRRMYKDSIKQVQK
jgi:hypothetical protein